MPGQCGSAPQGAVHLSYFIRDQLYPGIRDKNGKARGHSADKDSGRGSFRERLFVGRGEENCFIRALAGGRFQVGEKIERYFAKFFRIEE